MSKIEEKKNDIRLKFSNYKLLKDKEVNLENCQVLLVQGGNEMGKTSLITALKSIFGVKSLSENNLSKNEEEGYVEATIPTADGKQITIKFEFNKFDGTGKFIAVTQEGKAISSVNTIRNLIGRFEPISLDRVYALIQTAEGRKKFIENNIYPLLTEDDVKEIKAIDIDVTNKKNKATEGNLYHTRTELNNKLSGLKTVTEQSKISEFEQKLIDNEAKLMAKSDSLDKAYTDMLDAKSKFENKQSITDKINKSIKETTGLIEEATEDIEQAKLKIEELKALIIKKEDYIKSSEKNIETAKEELANLEGDNTFSQEAFDELAKKRTDRDNAIMQLKVAKEKAKSSGSHDKDIKDLTKQIDDINTEMNEKKARKVEILSNANLPAGLSIEDEDFTLEGFNFDEVDISESKAWLVLGELMCQLYEARLVIMGNAKLYGPKRLNELSLLAEKHNKIIVLEEVLDDDTEVQVVSYVADEAEGKEKKAPAKAKKEVKPKEEPKKEAKEENTAPEEDGDDDINNMF